MNEDAQKPVENNPEADAYYGDNADTDEIDMSFLDDKTE